jgi:murein DD-endopeptidase MepM/ murein hydrolase activator NlpD
MLAAMRESGSRGRPTARRILRLGLPVAVLVVISLLQFMRYRRADGQVRFVPIVVNVVAMVFLVLLPLTHLVRALTVPRDGAPRIHAGFGDWLGAEGYPRLSPHRGIDVAGRIGADVLAAADVRVTVRGTTATCAG